MRLSPQTLAQVPDTVERFAYDRDTQAIGIVHFGIGAFHRAHQAWYTDRAMDRGERDWAICGLSLRSADVSQQLDPQGGLYTVTERSGDTAHSRVVGAVREVLFAGDDSAAAVARIATPDCRIVSFTVTEKGYCRDGSGGLDLELAESSFYPILSRALAQRAERGLPGVTLMSCDNLAENGRVLGRLMREWIAAREPGIADWFAANCTTPSTMVDRIVPRSTEEDLAALADRLGMEDAGAVFTEAFSQWVIEDDFAAGRPAWERVGAQMVADVVPYETAKLRMLNGAHSLLAYAGLRAGHEFVHQAMADPELADLARTLMREEALPTVDAAPEQDLPAYADELAERFRDPALRHRLAQIAMDGSQKIPQRWLDTARARINAGAPPTAIGAAFDAWCWHLEDGRFVDDPNGEALKRAAQSGGKGAVLDLCFGGDGSSAALWDGYAGLRPFFERT